LLTLIMIIFILCQHYCRLIITFCITTLTLCLIFLIYLLTDAILNILLPQKICNNCYKSSYYNKKKKNGHKSTFNCVAIEGSVIILSFVVMIIMLLLNITINGYIHQINMTAHFLLFLTFFHINYFIWIFCLYMSIVCCLKLTPIHLLVYWSVAWSCWRIYLFLFQLITTIYIPSLSFILKFYIIYFHIIHRHHIYLRVIDI